MYTAVALQRPQLRRGGLVGAPSHAPRGGAQLGGRAELVLEPVDGHLELHRADRREHRRLIAEVGVAQHLHHALLVELRDAAPELLEPARVPHPGHLEVLGRELGQPGELDGRLEVQRVAHGHVHRVHQADHVAGPRLLDRVALLPEHRVGVLGGERLARWVRG